MLKIITISYLVLPDLQLYHSETLELMLQRWSKLERDFRMKNGRYDISKIPDIYDCIKYDTQHNASLGLEETLELFRLSRALADIIIPQVSFVAHFRFSQAISSVVIDVEDTVERFHYT